MVNKNNPYESLGISTNVSIKEIKKAYRRLALKFHPDRAKKEGLDPKHSESKFKEIGEAYDLLSDSNKRKHFDRFGWEGVSRSNSYARESGFNNPFYSPIDPWEIFNNFFGSNNNYQSFSSSSDSFYNENDSFDNPFRNISKNDLDITAEVNVSLKEAFNGKEIILQPNELNSPIRLKIPERSKNRTKFIIKNNGIHDGSDTGDLILILNITDFNGYTINGIDLHMELKVDNMIMSNGGEIRIKYLDDSNILIKIPKNEIIGSLFRIKGKGLKNKNETGNLIIHTVS